MPEKRENVQKLRFLPLDLFAFGDWGLCQKTDQEKFPSLDFTADAHFSLHLNIKTNWLLKKCL